MTTIREFQDRIGRWVKTTFDEVTAANIPERGLRVCEEACELAQAIGIPRQQLHTLIDYVYRRPKGEVGQELAGVMVTIAACATACEQDLALAVADEANRIETPEVIERVRARQAEKRQALMTADTVGLWSVEVEPKKLAPECISFRSEEERRLWQRVHVVALERGLPEGTADRSVLDFRERLGERPPEQGSLFDHMVTK